MMRKGVLRTGVIASALYLMMIMCTGQAQAVGLYNATASVETSVVTNGIAIDWYGYTYQKETDFTFDGWANAYETFSGDMDHMTQADGGTGSNGEAFSLVSTIGVYSHSAASDVTFRLNLSWDLQTEVYGEGGYGSYAWAEVVVQIWDDGKESGNKIFEYNSFVEEGYWYEHDIYDLSNTESGNMTFEITLTETEVLLVHTWAEGAAAMQEQPIPEPATVALLGIGLAGLAGAEVRRRRKKKAVDKS